MNKIEALAQHLECGVDEITGTECRYEYGRDEYLVCTEKEAENLVEEEIENSLCFFKPSWLEEWTGLEADCISAIQEKMYERSNGALKRLIGKEWEQFLNACVQADGAGHFLNKYNGEEYEVGEYLIYQA